jgi:hypothetical protein
VWRNPAKIVFVWHAKRKKLGKRHAKRKKVGFQPHKTRKAGISATPNAKSWDFSHTKRTQDNPSSPHVPTSGVACLLLDVLRVPLEGLVGDSRCVVIALRDGTYLCHGLGIGFGFGFGTGFGFGVGLGVGLLIGIRVGDGCGLRVGIGCHTRVRGVAAVP